MTSTTKEHQAGIRIRSRSALSCFGNLYRFAGRRFDNEVGLYYNRRRYYEPRTGRFVSRDPLEYNDGPNVHAYVHNKPATLVDPLGLRWLLPAYKRYQKVDKTVFRYVDRLKDARGRTEVYYAVWTACRCDRETNTWTLKIHFGLVFEIRLEKSLQQAPAQERRGIYGHELRHVASIEARLFEEQQRLISLIKSLERGKQGKGYTKTTCESQMKYARQQVEAELGRIIGAGAGHDDDLKTPKPAERELIEPPGGFMPEPTMEMLKEQEKAWKEVKKDLQAGGYKHYTP